MAMHAGSCVNVFRTWFGQMAKAAEDERQHNPDAGIAGVDEIYRMRAAMLERMRHAGHRSVSLRVAARNAAEAAKAEGKMLRQRMHSAVHAWLHGKHAAPAPVIGSREPALASSGTAAGTLANPTQEGGQGGERAGKRQPNTVLPQATRRARAANTAMTGQRALQRPMVGRTGGRFDASTRAHAGISASGAGMFAQDFAHAAGSPAADSQLAQAHYATAAAQARAAAAERAEAAAQRHEAEAAHKADKALERAAEAAAFRETLPARLRESSASASGTPGRIGGDARGGGRWDMKTGKTGAGAEMCLRA